MQASTFAGAFAGVTAEQRRQLKQGSAPQPFERRNCGARLRNQAFRSHHVEIGIRAGFMTVRGDVGFASDDLQ